MAAPCNVGPRSLCSKSRPSSPPRMYLGLPLATMRGVTEVHQSAGLRGEAVADIDVNPAEALLQVENLRTSFFTAEGAVHAVDNVSFNVRRGEAVALVGESGCGKSVTAMSIMRLVAPPGRITGGSIRFRGSDLAELSEREMRNVRGNDIAMVFQEPITSLNPVFKIGQQVAEAIRIHKKVSKKEAWKQAGDML